MIPDFHTHHISNRTALISAADFHCAPLVSKEFHPWQLPETYFPLPAFDLKNFAALGETGLDRLRGPALEVQARYLQDLLKIAADNSKPAVFHVVRAFPELFALLKPFSLRWMIHGFRGKRTMLEEIWKRGGTVSFHHSVLDDPAIIEVLKNPGGSFGFESDDDAALDLDQVIYRAVELSGNPALPEIIKENFQRFIYGK